jgi:hypothetical protein
MISPAYTWPPSAIPPKRSLCGTEMEIREWHVLECT